MRIFIYAHTHYFVLFLAHQELHFISQFFKWIISEKYPSKRTFEKVFDVLPISIQEKKRFVWYPFVTLPETNTSPLKKRWLEDDPFLPSFGTWDSARFFRGEFVKLRV